MSNYYLDSSALLKYYIPETGTTRVTELIESEENSIFISLITLAEIASSLARRSRASDGISNSERQQLLGKFMADSQTTFVLSPVQRSIIDQAVSLSQSYRLRGYDSVQLGTALHIQDTVTKQEDAPEFTFVASDTDLLLAAQAEGLQTENPMVY